METLGLMYEAMIEYREVKVSVARDPQQLLPERSYESSHINVIRANKTPLEILEEFEGIVCQNLEGVLVGCARDIYRRNPQFKDRPIHTTFLSSNAYEHHRDLKSDDERKSDENDRLIHDRIFPLYETFVQRFL